MAKQGAEGVRFADVLVIEGDPPAGQPPRVETFSCKSRDFLLMEEEALTAQLKADAKEALRYYGETLDIRRPSLKHLGPKVPVQRVRLIYEGGSLKPRKAEILEPSLRKAQDGVKGVEVLFE